MSYADRDMPIDGNEEHFTSGMEEIESTPYYVLLVPDGRYEADTLPKLLWRVLKCRFGHLLRDREWRD